MTNYNPREIRGRWAAGYVLDFHSTGSTYIGDDELGHPQFETERTEIGDLLFRLKYRSDKTVVNELVDIAATFIREWGIEITAILPVPPSRTDRTLQPVALLVDNLGEQLQISVASDAVHKCRESAELKNVRNAKERRRLLEESFEVEASRIKNQSLLLFDDLYRSGATMNAITDILMTSGAAAVYAFAFTRTRSGK